MPKLAVDNQIDYDLGVLFFELFTLPVEGLYLHLPRVPECLSLRPNWLPRPRSDCVSPPWNQRGGVAGGSQFGRLERKPCILCMLRVRLLASLLVNGKESYVLYNIYEHYMYVDLPETRMIG